MKTFTLNSGNTYTQQDNGYCFATINGKKTRCSTASFKMAHDQFVKEENERQNAVNEFTNIEALIEQAEEDTKTEEAKEIAKKMAPKAKKIRKSKDIAWAGNGINAPHTVTLTSKQVDFILHLSDTNFWENGLDSCIWVDILCDEIGGEFAGKPMTVGAMISTLCEKGLGTRGKDRVNGRKCTSFALTELGKKVAAEVGLH